MVYISFWTHPIQPCVFVGEKAPVIVCYRCFGHPSSIVTLKSIFRYSLPVLHKPSHFCSSCQLGKSCRLPFVPSNKILYHPVDMFIWCWVHVPNHSIYGAKYYIHFIDAFNRSMWIFSLKCNSKIPNVHLTTRLRFFFCRNIRSSYRDGGTESKPIYSLFSTLVIIHRISCPYIHEQNDSSKRKHKNIV